MSEKEKVIIPGAYARLSYVAMTKEGEITESTKRKIKEGEEEKEIDQPIVIKIGSGEIFFEDELVGLKEGDEKEFVLPPERAYGRRDPSKVERIPIKKLKAMLGGKKPYVGAMLYGEDDRYYGKIIYVGSRDAMVDRNHPFADKEIIVKVKIHEIVPPEASMNEKAKIILMRYLSDLSDKIALNVKENMLEVITPADITMKFTAVDLLRRVWVNRKSLADELLKELDVNEVRFIDEFKLESVMGEKSKSDELNKENE